MRSGVSWSGTIHGLGSGGLKRGEVFAGVSAGCTRYR